MKMLRALVASAAAMALAGAASAAIVVDQSNTSVPGQTNSPNIGQSFTAGINGSLVGIEFFGQSAYSNSAYNLVNSKVSLYSGDGLTIGNLLGSVTTVSTATANGFRFDLSSGGFTIQAGQQYTINAAQVAPTQYGFVYLLSSNNAYTGGRGYLNTYPNESFDTGFRTYVDNSIAAVPEPASWALMLAGFGLVGGALRRQRNSIVRFG